MKNLDEILSLDKLGDIDLNASASHIHEVLGAPKEDELNSIGLRELKYPSHGLVFTLSPPDHKDCPSQLVCIRYNRQNPSINGNRLIGNSAGEVKGFVENTLLVETDGEVRHWHSDLDYTSDAKLRTKIEAPSLGLVFWFEDSRLTSIDIYSDPFDEHR